MADEPEDKDPGADDEDRDDGPDGIDEDPAEDLLRCLESLPLFDSVFLLMQARSVAIVDAHLRGLEDEMIGAYFRSDHAPMMELATVSAVSTLWIFGLYELLRTWRQQVNRLLEYDACLARFRGTPKFDKKRAAAYARLGPKAAAAPSEEFVEQVYGEPFRRIEEEPDFAVELRTAKEAVQPVMERIAELRVTLAKHEVPGRQGFRAYAPGYARIDTVSGSLRWFWDRADGYQDMVSRRQLPDDLRKAVRRWRARRWRERVEGEADTQRSSTCGPSGSEQR